LCKELKNGRKDIILMTITGGSACLRMDVNAAQVEELILENNWVDI
jgi:hypothetical protein